VHCGRLQRDKCLHVCDTHDSSYCSSIDVVAKVAVVSGVLQDSTV
jgi:hypothetical protein